MATCVYVDGFNLYYGALKGTPYRWLDLEQPAAALLPEDEIARIRYFTARVSGRTNPQPQPPGSNAPCQAAAEGRKTVEVMKTEEKGSDVNLATYLLRDGFCGEYDTAVVMSNDSDLAEPIRIVIAELGLRVGLVNPHPAARRSHKLQQIGPTFFKQLRRSALANSQFPDPVVDSRGSSIPKPQGW